MSTPRASAVEHLDDLLPYSPPGHSGTTNVRLVEAAEGKQFEMVYGTMASGGEAARHAHADAYQAIFVVAGEALVELGDEPVRRCGAGSIIRIPPGVEHFVKSSGDEALRMVIVYSPPL